MADEELIITKKGLEEKKVRLKELLEVIKPQALNELNLARSQGDLSENADYDAAIKKTQEIENEINQIKYVIDHAKIVDEDKNQSNSNTVRLSVKVKIKNLSTKDVYEVVIVGSTEAKPLENEISNKSPIAQAIFGKKVGDIVEVKAKNPYKAEILEIK